MNALRKKSKTQGSRDVTKVSVDLEPWVEAVIDRALSKHIQDCPIESRVRKLELSWAKACGMAIGAGAIGGLVSKGVATWIGI